MTYIRFDNQVVLITGAGRGLGAAYAQLFAERGASVIIHDAGVNRDGTGGDSGPALSVAESIETRGGTALVETLNLSDQAACKALIDNVMTKCGRLDVLVHSATSLNNVCSQQQTRSSRAPKQSFDCCRCLIQAGLVNRVKVK